ncbi:hypothetical protein [Nodularia sphaerocarpa]|uniref:hypothetical protein n=1 Tax=Nodularia sphaerocarpa TaxID=137816 RepID=UPI001EFAA539|nr:hypothetical protein [Nodularia sphaerocarpa]MDB9374890.1 hypothetical protein [Nodularia sphaerocarpa CS-585]MDB9376677.1 hypothetical protein [Nodularia sphaerocarpa CS-585A2]ULP71550.1 hypothetical protein BDGGKGIB_01177 [Nodularia sphaerocarpa UHCC 0038]
MKQMMTISGGILFTVGIISLIFAGGSFYEVIKFQNELESRGQAEKLIRQVTELDRLDEKALKEKQDLMVNSLVIAGIFGSVGIGLALAGRTKATQETSN